MSGKKNLNVSLRASTLTLEEYMNESPDIRSVITECPICISILIEPVTLLCGHSFCKLCELSCISTKGGIKSCSLCRMCYSDQPKVNIILHNILKCVFGNKYIDECIKRNSKGIKFQADNINFPNSPVDSNEITKNCLVID